MLTDDSANEQYKIQNTFNRLVDSKIKITHLFCKSYILYILHTKLFYSTNNKV